MSKNNMGKEKRIGSEKQEEVFEPSGVNHLLVIAINEYLSAPKLGNCVRDAEALIKVLTEKYRFDPEHVQVIFDKEATRVNILKTLARYKETIKPGDSLLICFSGHGETYENVGYWVPVEGIVGSRPSYISNHDIQVELNTIDCFHMILIVDACFSGSLFTSHRSISPGNEDRKSRWGLASSHSKEVALDGTPGENSPFATYLIKNLKENEADVGFHKLSAEVIDDVRRALNGRQNPVFQPLNITGHDLGQFVFRLRGQNTVVDPRDGRVYRTVQINGKTWMAQNLNFDVGEGSWDYGNDPRIGKVFGRLYTWEAAQVACMPGWRLPTKQEIEELVNIYSDEQQAFAALIEGGGNGFNALLGGGHQASISTFVDLGAGGYYWSATDQDKGRAYSYYFDGEKKILRRHEVNIGVGMSLRCIKD